MLVALDRRLRAATIAGITCEYREKLFPYAHHCVCNHWPNVMTYWTEPEIAVLGMPAAIQYMTMDDWTAHFAANNFPTIQTLFRENGYADRTECVYWPTGHMMDRPKRERCLVGGKVGPRQPSRRDSPEPDNIAVFTPQQVLQWQAKAPNERRFEDYTAQNFHRETRLGDGVQGWESYSAKMKEALPRLLGEDHAIPAVSTAEKRGHTTNCRRQEKPKWRGRRDFAQEFLVPSEHHIAIPTLVIYPPAGTKPR